MFLATNNDAFNPSMYDDDMSTTLLGICWVKSNPDSCVKPDMKGVLTRATISSKKSVDGLPTKTCCA